MSVSWTCPECGLDYDTVTDRDAVLAVRTFPYRYKKLLTALEPGEDMEVLLRERPERGVWSAIEYTAHVAQTLDLMAPSIRQIVNEDNPHLYEFDPDRQAAEQAYNDWSFTDVLSELDSACAEESATSLIAGTAITATAAADAWAGSIWARARTARTFA